MDIKEYISSGIIEGYVLNNISEQEMCEVECMAHIYPEIKEELNKHQQAFENYVSEFAITPPRQLKEKILSSINDEFKPEAKITDRKKSNDSFWKYSAAASIGFFIITAVFVMVQKDRNKELSDKIKIVSKQLSNDSLQIVEMKNNLNAQGSMLALYSNPNNKMIILQGMKDKDPGAKAMICWNKENKEVFIEVDKLPQAPKGMEYQLWAIVDGKPVDLGTMDTSDPRDRTFHKMKPVNEPEAFAVTLEVKGGSKEPTMSEMYVMGNI